jgi:hypothetical protein
MDDGRICDGIGFAQIKPDLRCASTPDRRGHASTERRILCLCQAMGGHGL